MRFILKIFHNEHIALLWALAIELITHGFFGLQAFLLGGFLGEVALIKIFGPELGVQIGAWSLGVIVFGIAFVSFVLGQYLKAHVQSFIWAGKGGQEYMKAFEETVKLAIGLELSSLAFRVVIVGWHDGDWALAIIIAVAGCILLRYAIAMAKVIHASVNRDPAYDLARSQDEAGITLADKARKYTGKMSPEQLARWAGGDASALQEVAGNGFFEEEQKRQARQAKKEAKRTKELDEARREHEGRERQAQAGETARRLLDPRNWIRQKPDRMDRWADGDDPKLDPIMAQTSSQANRLSQNGNHR